MKIQELIEAAPLYNPTECFVNTKEVIDGVPSNFRLTDSHVEYLYKKSDQDEIWVDVCSRLVITTQTRNSDSENWGKVLVFKDPDNREHQLAVSGNLLATDGNQVKEELLRLGLDINPSAPRDALVKYIRSCKPTMRILCTEIIGWDRENTAFCLPDTTIGTPPTKLQTNTLIDHAYETKGTLEEWQKQIAAFAIGNSRLILPICAAFGAPLLNLIGHENFGFHLRGKSSSGKSTVIKTAASIWGNKNYTRQWRATSNGLESIAATHNDALLCLDELSQASALDVGAVIYMLANGMGKARANRSGLARKALKWRTILGSTGEISLADKLNENGNNSSAGQEVRFIDISADAGVGLGIFEELHGFPSASKFADHLVKESAKNFGFPIRAFLTKLVELDPDTRSVQLKDKMQFFISSLSVSGDGQVQRVANHFALLAISGELATELGILPWTQGEATKAMQRLFKEWLHNRGNSNALEEGRILSQIKSFFEVHGESHFVKIKPKDNFGFQEVETASRVLKRCGYRNDVSDGTEYYVFSEIFKKEICKGLDARLAAKFLLENGYTSSNEKRRNTYKVTLPVSNKPIRCYKFTPKIFSYDSELGSDGTSGIVPISPYLSNNTSEMALSQSINEQWDNGITEVIPTVPSDRSEWEQPQLKVEHDFPTVPNNPTEKVNDIHLKWITRDFNLIFQFATDNGDDEPPHVYDLCARVINRLGGWVEFCSKANENQTNLQQDFSKVYEEFIVGKLRGDYEFDRLPILKGRICEHESLRITKDEFLVGVGQA